MMIFLINMPFAALAAPSIGLSQLKEALARSALVDRADVQIIYLNHDFARFLDDKLFYDHAMSNHGFSSGIGDWFFRQAAFPGADDSSAEYLSLYYPGESGIDARLRDLASGRRLELDAFLDQMIEKYGLAAADVVGFTSIFSQTTASIAMARRLKVLNPGVVTLMGGAACMGDAGKALVENCEVIDYVFSGCGLLSFPEFIRSHLSGDRTACERIDGVFSKTNIKRSEASGVRTERNVALFGAEPDINLTPTPDYTDFLDRFEENFGNSGMKPRLLFETSRGCWWGERHHCRFCGLNGPCIRFRAMSPDRAIAHINSVLRYADRCGFFASVDNILPREYIADVLPRIELKPGGKIQYEVRADLNEKEIAALCKAGVTLVQPGIEAISTESLKLMGKGLSAFSNIRFLKACSRHPVSLGWNLLIFVPGEAEETYQRYLDLFPLLYHLHPPLAVYPIEFVRYSEYVEHPEQYGLSLCPEPFYSMIYPFDEQTIGRLAHKFMNTQADSRKIRSWMDKLGAAIEAWRVRWLNSDKFQQSRLCLLEADGETVVYDSRSGRVTEHPLGKGALEILRFLEKERSVSEIEARFANESGGDPAKVMDDFRKRGLLFEENGRFMSLVAI